MWLGHSLLPAAAQLLWTSSWTSASAAWLHSPSSHLRAKASLHGAGQQLLVPEAQADVPPGRGTEQPSGSADALDVLAGPQRSSVGAQSSDKVVPLSLLGAAVLAPTSSTLSLTQPGLGADT